MKRASLPIRMRGWFFSMPAMTRSAAAAGVVLATASKRSIDWARRALSVTPAPVRALRTMLVAAPAGVEAVRRGLALAVAADFGGDGLQPGLVAIGQRQIAAARGQFQRQGTADAACRAGDGGGTPGNSGHCGQLLADEKTGRGEWGR